MITPEIQELLAYADESHEAAKTLIQGRFIGFSAAQSYYTMFYLAQALLLSKGLKYSSHSAVIAAYGKEFSKTGLLDQKFPASNGICGFRFAHTRLLRN
ncbi:MAG: HEPN domain-containing protein [Chloroflexota bacterium]